MYRLSFYIPKVGRISPIQETQMTICTDRNVHNLAVKGTFDDRQDVVKALFGDSDMNQNLKLGAVNSINFERVIWFLAKGKAPTSMLLCFYAAFMLIDL